MTWVFRGVAVHAAIPRGSRAAEGATPCSAKSTSCAFCPARGESRPGAGDMKLLCINHHLYQEGDTYGLIYAIQLSRVLTKIGDIDRVYGLFWINKDDYDSDPEYEKKIRRRIGYFSS